MGTVFLLAPVVLGRLSLQRLERTSTQITNGPWMPLLAQCRDELSARCEVRLLRSDRRAMPMTWTSGLPGASRPTILLPAEADEWPAERRRVVLLHELAHIMRRDCFTQGITQLTCALHWFNPLIWLASKRMQVERERACDDLVLAAGAKPSDYAEHLLRIASGLQSHLFATYSGIAMARKSKLEGRVLAILDATRNRHPLTPKRIASLP